MKKRALPFALFMLLVGIPAHAQDALKGRISNEGRIQEIMEARYETARLEMQYAYDLLMERLNPSQQKQLEAVQRDWDEYSKSECNLGTTIVANDLPAALHYQDCMIQMALTRTDILNAYLEEGNVVFSSGPITQGKPSDQH